MIEIERKFLVTSHAFKNQAHSKTHIIQGFLNTDKARTVRVRLKGDKGVLLKFSKYNQDNRFDIPVIGLKTFKLLFL